LTSIPFHWPLALFFSPQMYLLHKQLNTLYQFWIHTELVGHLGPIEWIMNTPRHHSVHHARNRDYIDKNYAGVFIIWDRLFGTFIECDEPPVYGLVHPLNSWSQFWVQNHHIWHVVTTFRSTKGIRDKLRVLFYGPGWHKGTGRLGNVLEIPDVHRPQMKYDRSMGEEVLWLYVAWQTALILGAALIIPHLGLGRWGTLAANVYTWIGCLGVSLMMEDRKSGRMVEMTRNSCFLLGLAIAGRDLPHKTLVGLTAIMIISLLLLSKVKTKRRGVAINAPLFTIMKEVSSKTD